MRKVPATGNLAQGSIGPPRKPVKRATELLDRATLGTQFAAASDAHAGQSGFRIITAGVDGFLARAQIIDHAEKTLDLQYFIFRGDETGRLHEQRAEPKPR